MRISQKIYFLLFLLLLAGVVFTSCGVKSSSEKNVQTGTPDREKKIVGKFDDVNEQYRAVLSQFEESPPARIISIAPSTTELLFEYGVGNLVIASVEPHDFPPDAQKLDSVGNLSLNIEKIILLKPDIIIGEKNLFLGQMQSLMDLGLPVLLFDTRTVDDLWQNLRVFDYLFQMEISEKLKHDTLFSMNEAAPPTRGIRIAGVISSAPLILAGGGSFMSSLITTAGCTNIMGDISGDYITISREELIAKDPEVIIYTYKNIGEELRKEKSLKGVTAIKENRLLEVDPDIFLRPTLRSVREGVKILRQNLSEIKKSPERTG